MKLSFLVIFILLFSSITAHDPEVKFGLIEPNGYRKYIYSESLTPLLFATPDVTVSKLYPDKINFDIYYTPTSPISLGLERRDNRFIELLELFFNPEKNIELRSINLYSESIGEINKLIHHGLFIKRTGIYSNGLIFLNSLSPIYRKGSKLLFYNSLKLYYMEISNLLEYRNSYISPNGDKQSDGIKSKSYLTLYPKSWLEVGYINYLNSRDDVLTTTNSLKFKFSVPFTTITLNGAIKERTKHEFSYGADVTNSSTYLKNEVNFKIRYINANLYGFSETLTLIPLKNFKISARYNFDYILKVEQEFIGRVTYESTNWRLSISYEQPINEPDKYWSINGLIYHTCH